MNKNGLFRSTRGIFDVMKYEASKELQVKPDENIINNKEFEVDQSIIEKIIDMSEK